MSGRKLELTNHLCLPSEHSLVFMNNGRSAMWPTKMTPRKVRHRRHPDTNSNLHSLHGRLSPPTIVTSLLYKNCCVTLSILARYQPLLEGKHGRKRKVWMELPFLPCFPRSTRTRRFTDESKLDFLLTSREINLEREMHGNSCEFHHCPAFLKWRRRTESS